MRTLVAAALIGLLPGAAQAIQRYDVDRMSCRQVHAVVQRDNAAILRHRSPRSGMILYDRYVSDSRFCPAYTYPVLDYLPTADNPSCPVYHCRHADEIPGIIGND